MQREYTAQEKHRLNRLNQVMEAAKSVASKLPEEHSRQVLNTLENIQFYTGYAEPGCEKEAFVCVGNWNTVTKYDRLTNGQMVISNLPQRVSEALDMLKIETEWCDEWAVCDDCNLIVRTQPDSYSWHPSYIEHNGELICAGCFRDAPSNFMWRIEDKHLVLQLPFDYDFSDDYEKHKEIQLPEQNPNPTAWMNEIHAELKERDIRQYFIQRTGTYSDTFICWINKEDLDESKN